MSTGNTRPGMRIRVSIDLWRKRDCVEVAKGWRRGWRRHQTASMSRLHWYLERKRTCQFITEAYYETQVPIFRSSQNSGALCHLKRPTGVFWTMVRRMGRYLSRLWQHVGVSTNSRFPENWPLTTLPGRGADSARNSNMLRWCTLVAGWVDTLLRVPAGHLCTQVCSTTIGDSTRPLFTSW